MSSRGSSNSNYFLAHLGFFDKPRPIADTPSDKARRTQRKKHRGVYLLDILVFLGAIPGLLKPFARQSVAKPVRCGGAVRVGFPQDLYAPWCSAH